jgi:hypothetical protein
LSMRFKNVRHFAEYVILAVVENTKLIQPLMSNKCYIRKSLILRGFMNVKTVKKSILFSISSQGFVS